MEVEQDHMIISGGMEDREVIAIMAIWWCYRGKTRGRVVEWRVSFSISF